MTWKVYGPDLNGRFGGLQGTGGLEAVILDADGTTTGVINDQFGNGVATVTGTGGGASVTWNTTRVGAYGPLPGIQAQTLTDVSQLAAATVWRSRRIDPTGFYWLGARYYEPTSGRFLSADPMGQAASPSLYDFAHGDPVNYFDPTGRIFGTGLSTGEFFGALGSGALHGAEAFADGANPFGNPFASHNFYNPNDPSLRISRAIGTATAVTEASLVAAAAGGAIIADAYAAHQISATTALTYSAITGAGISVVGNTATQLKNNGGDWAAVDPDQQYISLLTGTAFGAGSGVAVLSRSFVADSAAAGIINLEEKGASIEADLVALGLDRAAVDRALSGIFDALNSQTATAAAQAALIEGADLLSPLMEKAIAAQLEAELLGPRDRNGVVNSSDRDPTGKCYKAAIQ